MVEWFFAVEENQGKVPLLADPTVTAQTELPLTNDLGFSRSGLHLHRAHDDQIVSFKLRAIHFYASFEH